MVQCNTIDIWAIKAETLEKKNSENSYLRLVLYDQ